MAETKYSFEKECDGPRLTQEVGESAIVTALDRIERVTTTDIWFKAALSGGDETILSGLVTAHVNTPLPDNEIKTVALKSSVLDPDTGGLFSSPKYAPTGWSQRIHEIEFQTCQVGSIHDKNYLNQDIGWGTLKFYNSSNESLTTQESIDANCVRTDLEWMPNVDYMIKGGMVAQKTTPALNLYVWVQAAVLPDQYGGPQVTFCEGGMNMAYLDAKTQIGLDGVAGTVLHYNHPQLGAGAGTNKIRFIVRHEPGTKHSLQVILNIFRA